MTAPGLAGLQQSQGLLSCIEAVPNALGQSWQRWCLAAAAAKSGSVVLTLQEK